MLREQALHYKKAWQDSERKHLEAQVMGSQEAQIIMIKSMAIPRQPFLLPILTTVQPGTLGGGYPGQGGESGDSIDDRSGGDPGRNTEG